MYPPTAALTPVRLMLASMLVPMMLVMVAMLSACSDGDAAFDVSEATSASGTDLRFEIPIGSGEAIDAGAPLEILPARLDVSVGDVIEIVNDDDRGHVVGPFFIGAGETLRQQFSSPGEYVGECSVHPSGQIVVVVT